MDMGDSIPDAPTDHPRFKDEASKKSPFKFEPLDEDKSKKKGKSKKKKGGPEKSGPLHCEVEVIPEGPAEIELDDELIDLFKKRS